MTRPLATTLRILATGAALAAAQVPIQLTDSNESMVLRENAHIAEVRGGQANLHLRLTTH